MKVDNIIKTAAKRDYVLKAIMTTYNGEKHVIAFKNTHVKRYNSYNDFYNKVLKKEQV